MKNQAPMNTTLSRNRLLFTLALTAIALICCVPPARPATLDSGVNGTWTVTGDLVSRSYARAAALLADGKVLLAGRAGSSDSTNSEVYEVTSGKWTLTKPLNQRRSGPTLTLLPNGKVLATGGYNSAHGPLSSAELFDPVSQTWTNTRVMNSVHLHHTATLLPNGKVLVTGNCNGSNDVAKWVNEEREIGRVTRVTKVEYFPTGCWPARMIVLLLNYTIQPPEPGSAPHRSSNRADIIRQPC
jgi:Kelch motif